MKLQNLGSSDSGYSDLTSRIIFTVSILMLFRIGSFIPIPCINSSAIQELVAQNQQGVLGMFNVLSGGSLGRMSIFALTIIPYITASIVMQLLAVAYKSIDEMRKEDSAGRARFSQWSKFLTIGLASFQAYGVAMTLEHLSSSAGPVVVLPGIFFKLSTILTLVVGTILLMWLGEQISSRGIGNGSSMIIFIGIVSGFPGGAISLFEFSRRGLVSYPALFGIILSAIGLLFIVVLCEKAFCKLDVQNPAKRIKTNSNYIPIKLNMAGVIPTMFASSVLLLPANIAGLYSSNSWVADWFSFYFSRGKIGFMLSYMLLIVFFSFFYLPFVFNSEDISNNLKKSGVFIAGRRPGGPTASYLDYVVTRVNVLGVLYLCIVCALPEMLASYFSYFSLSGTSLLICVNVVIDTTAQIQTHFMSRKYDSAVKKIRFS